MFDQLSLLDIPNATSSPESADGASQPGSPASLTIIRSGQDRAPASLTPMQALAQGMTTREPFGGPSAGSSSSAALQSSLEIRLRARLGVDGSPEYVLTWKHWDMQWGGRICALRASAPRTSGRDFTGWATPTTRDHKDTGNLSGSAIRKDGKPRDDTVPRQAFGVHLKSSLVYTESDGALNPELSRWLMGYPKEWGSCADTATPLTRSLERNS